MQKHFMGISSSHSRYINLLVILLVTMGIVCNVIFYSSFGTGFSSIVYAIIGMLLDLSKIVTIGLFVLFLTDFERYVVQVVLCAVSWFVLSLLSLGAAYGFLSQVNEQFEQKRLIASNVYQAHQGAVDSAQLKVDSLSNFASLDLNGLKSELSAEKTQVGAWQAKYDRCKPRHWTNCFNPAQAKIDIHTAAAAAIQAKIDNNEAYHSAIQHHNSVQQKLATLGTTGAVSAHPLFVNLARATGNDPASIKSFFIFLTSVVVELLASVLIFLKNTLQPPRDILHSVQPATLTPVQPLNTGLTREAHNVQPDGVDFDKIVAALKSGELKNASFNALRAFAGINQKQATAIRDQLIQNGKAQLGRGNELVLIK